jgi:hypothetical protein
MFSKRHFKTIAQILGQTEATQETINAFVQCFKVDNERFNLDKFTKAIIKAKGR